MTQGRWIICRALAGVLLMGVTAAAQQPRLTNAQVETRPSAGKLSSEFRTLVEAQSSPAWIGYSVPLVAGNRMCCGNFSGDAADSCGTCLLEKDKSANTQSDHIALEGPRRMAVMFRVERRTVGKIRIFSAECQLDAGGLPVHWFTGVSSEESIALLATFATRQDGSADDSHDRTANGALVAIAMHDDPAADRALENFVAAGQPDRLREQAVFWLGAARGRRGYDVLARLVREDSSEHLRDKAVFALYVSKEPQAVDAMIRTAREDPSTHVRSQALFWLAQKAGKRAAQAISSAVENDPETAVKRKAVFALSQMPREEGVPLLIQVARTNKNSAVRKEAMFWLGQSNDPRALAFFEEVLKRSRAPPPAAQA